MATSKFLRTFRTVQGVPITAATIWLVPQANTYPTGALALTPHATRDGQYYRDNVPDGEYKIYIDPAGGSSPTLYEEEIWIGEARITTISNHFDEADSFKLKTTGIKDKAVTKYVEFKNLFYKSRDCETPNVIFRNSNSTFGSNVSLIDSDDDFLSLGIQKCLRLTYGTLAGGGLEFYFSKDGYQSIDIDINGLAIGDTISAGFYLKPYLPDPNTELYYASLIFYTSALGYISNVDTSFSLSGNLINRLQLTGVIPATTKYIRFVIRNLGDVTSSNVIDIGGWFLIKGTADTNTLYVSNLDRNSNDSVSEGLTITEGKLAVDFGVVKFRKNTALDVADFGSSFAGVKYLEESGLLRVSKPTSGSNYQAIFFPPLTNVKFQIKEGFGAHLLVGRVSDSEYYTILISTSGAVDLYHFTSSGSSSTNAASGVTLPYAINVLGTIIKAELLSNNIIQISAKRLIDDDFVLCGEFNSNLITGATVTFGCITTTSLPTNRVRFINFYDDDYLSFENGKKIIDRAHDENGALNIENLDENYSIIIQKAGGNNIVTDLGSLKELILKDVGLVGGKQLTAADFSINGTNTGNLSMTGEDLYIDATSHDYYGIFLDTGFDLCFKGDYASTHFCLGKNSNGDFSAVILSSSNFGNTYDFDADGTYTDIVDLDLASLTARRWDSVNDLIWVSYKNGIYEFRLKKSGENDFTHWFSLNWDSIGNWAHLIEPKLGFVVNSAYGSPQKVASLSPIYYRNNLSAVAANSVVSNFTGKSLSICGDSISAASDAWHDYVSDNLGLVVENLAESGALICDSTYTVIDQMTNITAPDIIIISAGTNDYNGSKVIGTLATAMGKAVGSLDHDIFIEALRYICNYLVTNFPTAVILFATPIQRADGRTPNGGNELKAYVDAIIEVANYYSIGVIDNFRNCGITVETSATYLADGLHPNTAGKKRMGTYMSNIINLFGMRE